MLSYANPRDTIAAAAANQPALNATTLAFSFRNWRAYYFYCVIKGFVGNRGMATPIAHAGGGQFALHAKAMPGNPYDGHTLATVIPEIEA